MSAAFQLNKSQLFVAAGIATFVIVAIMTAMFLAQQETITGLSTKAPDSPALQNGINQHEDYAQPAESVLESTPASTESQLLYLIEEEKLAHDVYLVMYEKYGARVFGNILKSENNHQSRVLTLLESRNIPDPRSEIVGVFANQSLQKLYNDLIAQGNQSLTEAYKVGVAIEELDIADIKEDLSALDPAQTDVKTTLEALLRGSENHLRAFSRQVR